MTYEEQIHQKNVTKACMKIETKCFTLTYKTNINFYKEFRVEIREWREHMMPTKGDKQKQL